MAALVTTTVTGTLTTSDNLYVNKNNAAIDLQNGSGTSLFRAELGGNLSYLSTIGAYNMVLRTNQTTALTLDSSQNATFAGSLKAATILDAANSAGTSNQVLTSTGSALDWKTLSEISGVDGSGTASYIPKWTDSDTIGNSIIYDSGASVGISSVAFTSPAGTLHTQAVGTNTTYLDAYSTTNGTSSLMVFRKSDSDTAGTKTQTDSGDSLGTFSFYGVHTSSDWGLGASINVSQEGVSGGTYVPAHIAFATCTASAYAEQMRIDSAGNVGIGTDTPSSLLHVAGTTNDGNTLGQFFQSGTGRGLHVSRTVASATRQLVSFTQLSPTGGSTPVVHIQQADTGETALAISTDGSTENFTVSDVGEVYAKGSVGIGTTAPESKLHIRDATNPPEIRLEDAAGGTQTAKIVYDQTGQNSLVLSTQYQSATDLNLIQFAPADNVAMTIRGGTGTSDGQVGIGLSSPLTTLDLTKTSDTGERALKIQNSTTSFFVGVEKATSGNRFTGSQSDNAFVGTTSADGLELATNNTVRAIITSDGKVGIGTTSPLGLLAISGTVSPTVGDNAATNSLLFTGNTEWKGIVWTNAANARAALRYNQAGDYLTFSGLNSGGHDNDQLVIKSQTGKVGIGTNDPGQLLHVYKAGVLEPNFQSTTGRVGLQLNAGAAGDVGWILYSGYPAAGDFNIRESGVANHFVIKKTTGSVGIGTSSPSVGLEVAKTSADASFKVNRTDQTNIQLIAAGSSYVRASAALILQSNGANNRLTLAADGTSTFSGALGIGTATPYRNTHIYVAPNSDNFEGALQVGGTSAALGGYFGYNSTSSGRLSIISLNNAGGANAKVYLGFGLDGDGSPTKEVMTLTQEGKVIIGGNAPTKTFEVKYASSSTNVTEEGLNGGGAGTGLLIYNSQESDNVYANLDFRARNADGRIAYQYQTATNVGDFHFITDNTGSPQSMMTIKNDGKVGIGTNSPSYLLDLESTATGLTHNLKLNKSSTTGDYAEIAFQLWSGAGTGLNTFGGSGTSRPSVVLRAVNENTSSAAGAFVVGTFTGGSTNSTLTEKFRITSAGNVGIGTDAPAVELHINDASGLSAIRLTGGAASADGFQIMQGVTGVTNAGFSIYDVDATATRLVIDTNGNVGIGETNPDKPLHIKGTNTAGIVIENTTNATNMDIDWYNNSGSVAGRMRYSEGTGDFTFMPNQSTASVMFKYDGDVEVLDGQLQVISGAVSAPSFSFTNDTNTGMSRPTTDALNFITNGSERVRINSSGSVGIGTDNPQYLLEVYGDATLNSSGSTTDVTLRLEAAGTTKWRIRNDTQVAGGTADTLTFTSAGAANVSINQAGNVGIGTAAAANLLYVYGGNDITPTNAGVGQFAVRGNGYVTFLAMDATAAYFGHNSSARSLVLMTNETARLTIAGDGAATFSGTLISGGFFGNGSGVTSLNATNIASGTVNVNRLGSSGSRTASTFLSGDNTWKTVTSGGGSVTSVAVTVGTGLDVSGSPITSSGTIDIDLDLSDFTDMTADITTSDEVILLDSGAERRKAFGELKLSKFNNDSGWTSNTGDITAVTAGTALSGGGTSGSVTLNVANPFLLGDNTDTYGIIGMAKFGYIGHSDYAGFAHRDKGTTTSYALIQNSAGATFLNAANGQIISFRINNANVIAMDSTSLYSVSNGVENLGKTGNRWGIVYSEDGNFSGDITVDGNWNGLDWEDLPNISTLGALPA